MKTPKPLVLLICFLVFSFNTVTAQTYDPYAVQVINNLIANNGLQATPDAPETWELFTVWNDSIPKQLIEACFYGYDPPFPELFGEASFEGLTTLQVLQCHYDRKLTKLNLKNCTGLEFLYCYSCSVSELNVTNCTALRVLSCSGNLLTELDLTNCLTRILVCQTNKLTKLILQGESILNNLQSLSCDENNLTELELTKFDSLKSFEGHNQKVSLNLCENETGEYTHSILLNNPTFGNSAISYWEEILKSTDNTVSSTSFTVQTGKPGFELSGTMNFTYSNGVNTQEKIELKVYPNPTTGELRITNRSSDRSKLSEANYELRITNIEVFDIVGRKQKAEGRKQNGDSEIIIDISHLQSGIYFVKVNTESGQVVEKIIKH
jgi:hypothetical protein